MEKHKYEKGGNEKGNLGKEKSDNGNYETEQLKQGNSEKVKSEKRQV